MTLTMQLRALERDGLVLRPAYAATPLRVEYELTDAACGLLPAFKELLGWGLIQLITELLKSDQFFFPAVLRARTCAWAALCVAAAGAASALVVRRRIDRLDMVAALKTRD